MKPVLVSTWGSPQKHLAAFLATTDKHRLQPWNADPSDWGGGGDWKKIPWGNKPKAYLKFVQEHGAEFTHFAFSDSYDIAFATGWDEIVPKYERFHSPVVFAAECYPWPKPEQAPLYPPTPHRCKYLNAGFWMADLVGALRVLEMLNAKCEKGQDDQGALVDIFLANQDWIKLDTACSLAFCCNMDSLGVLEARDGRWTCKDTGEQPCLFHGNGASPVQTLFPLLLP